MRENRIAFTARLLRPADLLDLRVTAAGTDLIRRAGAVVVGEDGGLLVVELAFQHLGEQAFPESLVHPDPSGIARHRAARPSRLVYDLPAGTKLPWTVAGLLSVLPTLRLRVVPLATPASGSAAPARRVRPREPEPEETAVELPYRLVVSPSAEYGAFVHDVEPLVAGEDTTRAQLWRTRLTSRAEGERPADHTEDPAERVVRAVWSRDMGAADVGDDSDVVLMSTNPVDRRTLVRQSAAVHEGITPVPIRVDHLHLSAVGAWVDWRGAWDTTLWSGSFAGWGAGTVTLVSSYRHVAETGRDSYVRLAYPGFLFPFGHRADLVKVTERKVDEQTRTAYLRQRSFIVLRETVRTWTERDTPLRRVTLQPLVTPTLDPPPGGTDNVNSPFIPMRGGRPFAWDLLAEDRAGDPVVLAAPLLFVPDAAIVVMRDRGHTPAQIGTQLSSDYLPINLVEARGQHVSFARPAAHGDTRLEVTSLTWDGHTDTTAFTSRPYLVRTQAVVPALRHVGGQAPGTNLAFSPAYLSPAADDVEDPGFGPGNPGGLFLELLGTPVLVDFSTGSDRAGGFLTPNLMVRALSRDLGAVGEDGTSPGGLGDGRFDPRAFLQGALPKLFGLFDLVELIEAVTGEPLSLDAAPELLTEALDAVTAILTEAERLRAAVAEAQDRLTQDLAEAVATGAHQGAQDAIAAARAELDAAAGPLLARLTAAVDALRTLAGNPGGVAAAQDAVTELVGALGGLHPVLDHPRLPAAVRSALRTPLDALDALLSAADVLAAVADFAAGLLTPADGVTARFEWRPEIGSWPAGGTPVFRAKDPHGLSLAVVVRASAQGAPAVDVSAELRSFALELLPGEPLMAMNFSRLGFRVGSGTKPEVDVVLDGLEFRGALGFVETLRRMIPFDGFADPPYVDVAPDGVTAGFDLELPNVSVGVFSLENIALGADARVPFLGDAVTVGFFFCSKDAPFRLTVMAIGGGGWVALRLSPMGLVELEMGLEAAAALSVNLGVASGSVSVAVGVYLRLEGDAGSLTGYFRLRGEVDVLGLISAAITLELSLTYDLPTGKMIGRASIVVEVEVLFFSASVEITCERRLAGSQGDPVLADVMPPDAQGHSAAWSEYCAAFAPGA